MKNKIKLKWALCAVTAALAVMGLCFAWRCPLDCVYGENSGVFLFKKQLLWNIIGIAACIGAAMVPWRRWLKLAPWGMVAWLVLSVIAMLSPTRHGAHCWADFGIVGINVNLVLVFAWAPFTAWLCSKKYVSPPCFEQARVSAVESARKLRILEKNMPRLQLRSALWYNWRQKSILRRSK